MNKRWEVKTHGVKIISWKPNTNSGSRLRFMANYGISPSVLRQLSKLWRALGRKLLFTTSGRFLDFSRLGLAKDLEDPVLLSTTNA
jgi:hypothetical protein